MAFPCAMGIVNFIFSFVVGAGVGTYNSKYMKECFDDTFHLGRQKAGPLGEKLASGTRSLMEKTKSGTAAAASHVKTHGPTYVRQMSNSLKDLANKHLQPAEKPQA
mmetsp:Transcript_35669/g.63059  ORF Transcript_35669/g.63059 Transcript_35669/m.63059 type:complete len:106 (+) Transcript_35669:85-402(+)